MAAAETLREEGFGGRVVLISDAAGCKYVGDMAWQSISLPDVHPFVAPILYSIPVQLLAYHIAVLKGTDVGKHCFCTRMHTTVSHRSRARARGPVRLTRRGTCAAVAHSPPKARPHPAPPPQGCRTTGQA